MKTEQEIKEFTDCLQTKEHKEVYFDHKAIFEAYQASDNHQSLAVKILSIFGGILASLAFIGFLFISGLYNSDVGLVVFGCICISFGMGINTIQDKIIIDTISLSSYIIGFTLLAMGLYKMEIGENVICCIFILIAIVSLFVVKAYVFSFISVLIINGAFLRLIICSDAYDWIQFYTSCMAVILSVFYLKESKILAYNNAFSKLYSPARIALVFSFLAGLILFSIFYVGEFMQDDVWITSVFCIIAIIYLLSHIVKVLRVDRKKNRIGVYTVSILLLLPTVFCPGISGAILIIFLSFLVNDKTSFVIGIIAFIYFVSQYYYDLYFTLLTKSILLFCSGILFLGLYLLIHKKLKSDEKI